MSPFVRTHRHRPSRGFTLIELMIVLAVLAIIAVIAVPAFNDQMRKARRAEARAGLQEIALLQERYRANNPQYGANAGVIGARTTSENGYYAFAITAANATSWSATATPQGAQASDSTCGTLSYAFNGAAAPGSQITKLPVTSGCW